MLGRDRDALLLRQRLRQFRWICLATASGAPMMGAMAILAWAACGAAVVTGSATAVGDGLDEEPRRLLSGFAAGEAEASDKNAIAAKREGCLARRAAAASMVVTMTSPFDKPADNPAADVPTLRPLQVLTTGTSMTESLSQSGRVRPDAATAKMPACLIQA